MSTAITTKKASDLTLKQLLSQTKTKEQFAMALPPHINPDRFARVAITALTRNPDLTKCTQQSFMTCMMDLCALGLEPDDRKAHLIPYKDKCTLIIGYRGLIDLIRRSGEVTSIRSELVCEEDHFEWENGKITHRVNWRSSRGAIDCVYAEAKMKSGEIQTSVMTREEVEGIRERSRSGTSGPWKSDWGEMAKKTVIRRLSKMLPLSSEIMEHVSRDDDQFRDAMRQQPAHEAPTSNPFAKEGDEEATEVETEIVTDGPEMELEQEDAK